MIGKFRKYGFSTLRKALIIILISWLLVILFIFYFLYKQNQPVSYFMNEDGQNYKILPSDTPILQVDKVKQWATASIGLIFSFNFINYNSAMQTNKEYFTQDGWEAFQQELQDKNITNDVLNKNLIFKANVCDLPVLSNREQDPKAFYLSSKWKFIIPIIINIQGASGVTRNPVYIVETDVRFLTDSEITSKKGNEGDSLILGIDAIKMRSASFTNYCRIPY